MGGSGARVRARVVMCARASGGRLGMACLRRIDCGGDVLCG